MSIHEEVKYSCNQCNYKASQQGHLKTHKMSVHEGVKYSCNLCDYKASQQGHLKRHDMSVHKRDKHSWLLDLLVIRPQNQGPIP